MLPLSSTQQATTAKDSSKLPIKSITMAARLRFSFFLASIFTSVLVFSENISNPQNIELQIGCSNYNATNITTFFLNRETILSNLRSRLASSSQFATAENLRASIPIFAMTQCRDYLSTSDCLACFDAAVVRISRRCGAANSGRISCDGCFLRYETNNFYTQGTAEGDQGYCDSSTARVNTNGFDIAAVSLLQDLATATPRVNGIYFVAAERPVAGSNTTVYGIAQCTRLTSRADCGTCLNTAVKNIAQCPPDTQARAVDAGCFMRYSASRFFAANQTMELDRLLESDGYHVFFNKVGDSKQSKAFVIGAVGAGGGVLILGALMMVLFLRCKDRRKHKPYEGRPASFGYHELKHATGNFSDKNKLGQGGFAAVYKGKLSCGNCVAVKKMKISVTAKAKENFETEMALISNIHHRNLVRLLGCCRKGPDLLFVYEYMENGSLDRYLFGDKRGTLSWAQRFNVILGAARGLAFLHEEYYVCIIHRDIKSGNILLDEKFHPKLADFGLARLLPQDKTHESTRLAGTPGYTAPEYVVNGRLSEKVDTYSFGVVILETLSGLRSSKVQIEPVTMYLLEWCWRLYECDSLVEMVDKSMNPMEFNEEEVKRVAEIGLMCTQSSSRRPPMSKVVAMLLRKEEYKRLELSRPAFLGAAMNVRPAPSNTASSETPGSNAVMTISNLSAR